MPIVRVEEFSDSFVLHFGGEFTRINAYTLASTLINIADAAKAANEIINPGYDIEIVVEALGHGSFKAKIRSIYRGASNLFSKEHLKTIILAVIANFIYTHTLAPNIEMTVNVNQNEVVIVQGEKQIIVPRAVYDATQKIERSPSFRRGVGQMIRSVEDDPAITSIGISKDMTDITPPLEILRDQFAILPAYLEGPDSDVREIYEITELVISRAILERSRRRWEFFWHGIRISAPVTDDIFYEDFFAHRIKIAPGDALKVRLKIKQRLTPDSGIFVNETYEVVEVFEHLPRPSQLKLE